MTTRAAIYLRISEDKTGEEKGVDRQLQDALAVIRERGWVQAGDPYQDNSISASKRNVRRPAYDRMVADYQAGKFDAIVCYDLDRLTRQPRQLEDWIDAAQETGLAIVTTNGEADLSTDGGRMFARVKAAVARSEIERKGARHRRANAQRVEEGIPHGGRRRYGYEPGGMVPRPEEAAVVRRCFEAVAAGQSIRSIVTDLRREGVPGGTGSGWGNSRLRYMLLNPSYAGLLHVGEEALPSEKVQPIVSRELYEEVRAILTDDQRRTSPGPGRKHLASGFVACGVEDCPNTLRVHSGFYRCQIKTLNSNDRYIDPTGAAHPSIKVDLLDARLRKEMALALLTTTPAQLRGDDAPSVAPLIAQLDRLETAVAATMADRDDGLVSPQAARARLLTLRDERLEVEAALDAARASRTSSVTLSEMARDLILSSGVPHGPTRVIREVLPRVVEAIEAMDIDRQRDALQQLLAVQVQPGRGTDRIKVWHLVAEHLNPDLIPDV
ncbi:serine homologous recombinase [Microbacterium phage Percival]|uniref:Serine homologous recombinase n=1 Tax=Microbacterium phage Percival TaxID=2201439 RepID=A0A2Z4Q792_9CAUD|nr:serine homologous recombinase [Microbacterium phage Percival]